MELTALQIKEEMDRRKQKFIDYQRSEDYQERLVQRLQLNDAARDSVEARAMLWNLCARPENPAEGCIFFIENFAWTFDPRPQADPNNLPMILFDYQKDAIRDTVNHIIEGKDLLLEKSRDMGVTWLVFVYIPLWFWIFRDSVNILLGSYKEKLVDDRTRDSLFGMLDYSLDNLPKWILPKGFNKTKHRTQMKLVNPVNHNQITGDTMNPKFGRGARKTAVLFDELGFWDYAKDAWEGSGDVTACRIANSTPHGYNYYAELRNSGMDVLTIHWRRHPLKDDTWYAFEKLRRTDEEVAQELDISYTKSVEGVVYKEWLTDGSVVREARPYDPQLPLFVGWDFGQTDDTAIIWAQQTNDGKTVIVDTYRGAGKTIDFYVPFITGFVTNDLKGYMYTDSELEMIMEHKMWRPATHFGDPAGRFVNQVTNSSVVDELKKHGIIVNFRDEWKDFQMRKTSGKLLIRDGIILNDNARTHYFDMCMTQAAYPRVMMEGQREVRSVKPKHDWTSHYRSAFEYLALGLKEFRPQTQRPYDKIKKKERFGTKRVVGY